MQAPQLTRIEAAVHLAARAHCGQVDADGMPHIIHSMEVMFATKRAYEEHPETMGPYTLDELLVAAILHDCPEDSFDNPMALERVDLDRVVAEFGRNVAEIVDGVTRRKEGRKKETYRDFIYRARDNPGSRLLKTADLLCNLRRSDSHPDRKRREHLAYKYEIALRVINSVEPMTWETASGEFSFGKYFVADPNGNRKEISEARFRKLAKA